SARAVNDRPVAWLLRMRAAVTRRPKTFALLAVLLIACSAGVPVAVSPTPFESPFTPAPTATPKPIPAKARSVSALGNGAFAATGDFRGNGTSQLARIDDPKGDLAIRIAVSDRFDADPATWFATDRNFLSLARAKLAVADVDSDGKDDLVALYDSGGNTSRLFVFRSNGDGFVFDGP